MRVKLSGKTLLAALPSLSGECVSWEKKVVGVAGPMRDEIFLEEVGN